MCYLRAKGFPNMTLLLCNGQNGNKKHRRTQFWSGSMSNSVIIRLFWPIKPNVMWVFKSKCVIGFIPESQLPFTQSYPWLNLQCKSGVLTFSSIQAFWSVYLIWKDVSPQLPPPHPPTPPPMSENSSLNWAFAKHWEDNDNKQAGGFTLSSSENELRTCWVTC